MNIFVERQSSIDKYIIFGKNFHAVTYEHFSLQYITYILDI